MKGKKRVEKGKEKGNFEMSKTQYFQCKGIKGIKGKGFYKYLLVTQKKGKYIENINK